MKQASGMMLTLALMAIMAFIVGCQTAPGRTQTQQFDDCVFNIMVPAGSGASNVCSAAGSPSGAMGDLLSQNMLVDTSGSEVNSPTSTPTTTTPIDVMRGTGGGSSWADLGSGLKSLLFGDSETKAATSDTAAAAADTVKASATGDCADGSCSVGTTTGK
jgi:hypothetical protein